MLTSHRVLDSQPLVTSIQRGNVVKITLKPGESAEFDLPKGSKSKIHMPDGSTKPATKFWIRNNGTGTWYGYPKP